jgi:hypothetical protein
MPKYRECSAEVHDILTKVKAESFPPLAQAGVTFDCLFAFDGDLRHHGWPCAATIKINSQERRAAGANDVTLKIHEKTWADMDLQARRALIHHELCHLELQWLPGALLKTDDSNRPALKIVPHDWEFTGFASTARNYRDDSPEVKGAKALLENYGQLLLWDMLPAN